MRTLKFKHTSLKVLYFPHCHGSLSPLLRRKQICANALKYSTTNQTEWATNQYTVHSESVVISKTNNLNQIKVDGVLTPQCTPYHFLLHLTPQKTAQAVAISSPSPP